MFGDFTFPSVNANSGLWQLAQLIDFELERFLSLNNFLPREILSGLLGSFWSVKCAMLNVFLSNNEIIL